MSSPPKIDPRSFIWVNRFIAELSRLLHELADLHCVCSQSDIVELDCAIEVLVKARNDLVSHAVPDMAVKAVVDDPEGSYTNPLAEDSTVYL